MDISNQGQDVEDPTIAQFATYLWVWQRSNILHNSCQTTKRPTWHASPAWVGVSGGWLWPFSVVCSLLLSPGRPFGLDSYISLC